MAQPADPMMLYLIQPAAVFLLLIFVWLVQSLVVLYVSRKLIFPQLYKFKITEWVIAEAAIAIHEASHLLAAVFTGSAIDLKGSFLTSKAGRIAARREEAVGGWISSIIAAFAPAFLSSTIFFFSVVLFTRVQLPFADIFMFQPTDAGLIDSALAAVDNIILPFLVALASVMLQPSVVSAILVYFLIVLSITAGPSEGDWQAALSVLFAPLSLIPLFVILLAANYVFAQFGISILVPIIALVMFSLSIVMLGLAVALLLSAVLYSVAKALKR